MFAIQEKLTALPGKRHMLINVLTLAASRVSKLEGCRLYLVHEDLEEENAIWVYELWEDRQYHDESLQDAGVKALISEARPLIDGSMEGVEMRLVGGNGVHDLLW